MRSSSFLSSVAAAAFLLIPWSCAVSAQVRNEPFPGQAQSEAPKSALPELDPLPAQLTREQRSAFLELPPAVPPAKATPRQCQPAFYRTAYSRPLTPREVAFRESVYELAARHKQFVHVRLVDGKVLTGPITFANREAFLIQTNLLASPRTIHYRQLAEPPRPVLAAGTKTVRSLELTGLAVACVLLIPVALVVYPLIAVGVLKD